MLIILIYLIGSILGFFVVYDSITSTNSDMKDCPGAIIAYGLGIILSWITVFIYIYNKISDYVGEELN